MELFDKVFNSTTIYEMLFLNVKGVLEYPSLEHLKDANPVMYNRWEYLSEKKYTDKYDAEEAYQKKAPLYPEFSRIVAITYGFAYPENGELQRKFKKITSNNEIIILETLFDELKVISNERESSKKKEFPSLCGHNILRYDIPFLLKRYIKHNLETPMDEKKIPLLFKQLLSAKPWESTVVDTTNVWNFNGYGGGSLMLIADFLGLKKTVDLMNHTELSQFYWNNIDEDEKIVLKTISLQSATQVNLVIQLMNHLRYF